MISRRNLLAGTAAIAAAASLPAISGLLTPAPTAWVHVKWVDPEDPDWIWTRRVPAEIKIAASGALGNVDIEFTPGAGSFQHFEVWTGDVAGVSTRMQYVWPAGGVPRDLRHAMRPARRNQYTKITEVDHDRPLSFLDGERGELHLDHQWRLIAISRTYGPNSLADMEGSPFYKYRRDTGFKRNVA